MGVVNWMGKKLHLYFRYSLTEKVSISSIIYCGQPTTILLAVPKILSPEKITFLHHATLLQISQNIYTHHYFKIMS